MRLPGVLTSASGIIYNETAENTDEAAGTEGERRMNGMQRGIVTLLKSALNQQAYALPEDFDIEAAAPLITAQQLTAIAYDGAVRCGISRTNPAMQLPFTAY